MQLARDLGVANKPPLLKTLTCAGLVQDTAAKRFGLLFDLPDWVDVAAEPRTLHALLAPEALAAPAAPLPTLAERAALARDLACSVAELHGAGTLHKALHGGNVLFFPARFARAAAAASFARPVVGGFEASRPDQDGQLSLDVAGGAFDLYRHPELRDPSNALQGRPAAARRHDVYSLGLVLLEVGIWQRLDAHHQPKKSPVQNAERFFGLARRYLPHHMGTEYCDAVLACLDLEQRSLVQEPSSSTEEEAKGVSLELFIENVIRRLEM